MNQTLDNFMGMSIIGLKTFKHLWELLDKLNIDLTHKNTKNPITGKTQKVELDDVSTWLEEGTLVMTVESKTSELKEEQMSFMVGCFSHLSPQYKHK